MAAHTEMLGLKVATLLPYLQDLDMAHFQARRPRLEKQLAWEALQSLPTLVAASFCMAK
jgi:hypothetical protein